MCHNSCSVFGVALYFMDIPLIVLGWYTIGGHSGNCLKRNISRKCLGNNQFVFANFLKINILEITAAYKLNRQAGRILVCICHAQIRNLQLVEMTRNGAHWQLLKHFIIFSEYACMHACFQTLFLQQSI